MDIYPIHGYLPYPWISELVRRCISPVSSRTSPLIGKKSMDEIINPSIAPQNPWMGLLIHRSRHSAYSYLHDYMKTKIVHPLCNNLQIHHLLLCPK